MVFLAVWAVAGTALGLAGVPGTALRPLALLVVQPLWFLGVYLLVVALAPAMLRLHGGSGRPWSCGSASPPPRPT